MGIFERIGRISVFNRPRIKPGLDIERSGVGKFRVGDLKGNRLSPVRFDPRPGAIIAGGGLDNYPATSRQVDRGQRWNGGKELWRSDQDLRMITGQGTCFAPQHLIDPFSVKRPVADRVLGNLAEGVHPVIQDSDQVPAPVSRSFIFEPQRLIGNRPAKEDLSLGAWYAHPIRAFLNLIGIK